MNTHTPHPDSLIDLLRDPVAVARLAPGRPTSFVIEPDAETRRQIADALGLVALRKFRLTGDLRPMGRTDWELTAELGATVVQDCVVTLAPVTTRIEEQVTRRYLAQMPEPQATEVEMPEDDTLEALGREIDPGLVAFEALSLAIPQFPRAPEAQRDINIQNVIQAAPPGEAPLSDDDVKPFAGLKMLRDSLGNAKDKTKDKGNR